jgi:TatD DNase family protein
MLIDFHAHLDKYGRLIDSAIDEIRKDRIITIANSMDMPSYLKNMEIASRCNLVIPAFGIHPWNAPACVENIRDYNWIVDQSLMVGEIGLDKRFIADKDQYPAQYKVWEHLLERAVRKNKIVTIHTSGAEQEVLNYLESCRATKAIIHWYSGPLNLIEKYLALGCYFTIGVEIMFSEHIKEIARNLPEDRILTETDNPGGYEWLTGNFGMPSLIKTVINTLAIIRNTDYSECAYQMERNFYKLISDDKRIVSSFFGK